MKKILPIIFVLTLLIEHNLAAQVKLTHVGMGMRVGFSQNMRAMSKKTSLESLAPVFSYSFMGYGMLDFKPYHLERSSLLFPCLRFGLAASSRGGVFDVDGVATKLETTSIDVEAILPMLFPMSESLQFYFGIGGTASFMVSKSEDVADISTISPGAMIEAGILTSHGSYFGFNLLGIYNEYSIQNLSFTFGVPLSRH